MFITCFLDLWTNAYFVSSESRLIPCCSYYWPLLRRYDMNDCLSAIRSINWIQRNVIHYSLQPSRCWGFCKSNSFIMLIPLFCQMHHFHLSGVEKSSDGFGCLNKRCLTFNEMRNMGGRGGTHFNGKWHMTITTWRPFEGKEDCNCATIFFKALPCVDCALILPFGTENKE